MASPASSGSFSVGTNAPKRCTAMSKRSGLQCQGPAVLGSVNQKCRMHGGSSAHAIGPANQSFKSGRYSKYLPAKLTELYEEALANPDLIQMNDHIALLEARVQDIISGIDEGEIVPRWSDIADTFAGIETAILAGDADTRISGLERMHALLDAGAKWDRTWSEIVAVMEQLRKMTDTEVKRKKELNQMVPIERVTILVGALGDAVKRNVSNPNEVNMVIREIAMLYGGNSTGTDRVPPEVIDIPNETNRGVSGGASKPAIKRRKRMEGA